MQQFSKKVEEGASKFLITKMLGKTKQSREQIFKDWCGWSLKNHDCDPALWLLNYLFKRFEHNLEQKYWIAWIYGTTYHLPTAWIIWNEFPDFELVNQSRLQKWNDENFKRLRYQTDTKWNKGHLPQQYASYKRWVLHDNPEGTQRARFKKLMNKPFEYIWLSIVNNMHKFGRYSTWYYLQTLEECVGVPIYPNNLKLNDHSGSKSHRNGLLYALSHEDLINQKLDSNTIFYLEHQAARLKKELKDESNIDMNFYQMETLLCSFKKIFRNRDGRYLGYYLDRQAEEIKKVEQDEWNGIDWQVFWDGREETLHPKLAASKQIRKDLFSVFLDTGTLNYKTL